MQLRHRLVLLAAGTVGVTVLLASVICYFAMRAELHGQIDSALATQARLIERVARNPARSPPRGAFRRDRLPQPEDPGDSIAVLQTINSAGQRESSSHEALNLQPDADDRAIARAGTGRRFTERRAGGLHLRTLTVGVAGNGAVQLARSLREADATLARLRYVLACLVLLGTLFAVVVARAFARKVIAPVREIDEAAEHISTTQDLTRRISAVGDDEVGRMARRFNAMLGTLETSRDALAGSVAAHRQLVADASHELRTPITSLRTNIELLLTMPGRPGPEDRSMLEAARDQAEELSELVAHIIELGRGDQPITDFEEVYLDELVLATVDRVRRHTPGIAIHTTLEPTLLSGDPQRLARAVSNLLENAVKYGHSAAGIEVALLNGTLTVRDHGPGVPDSDKAHIFDRFYRGPQSRQRPGSGLGLAIVHQAATSHGGTIEILDTPGGGAEFHLHLPTARPVAGLSRFQPRAVRAGR